MSNVHCIFCGPIMRPEQAVVEAHMATRAHKQMRAEARVRPKRKHIRRKRAA